MGSKGLLSEVHGDPCVGRGGPGHEVEGRDEVGTLDHLRAVPGRSRPAAKRGRTDARHSTTCENWGRRGAEKGVLLRAHSVRDPEGLADQIGRVGDALRVVADVRTHVFGGASPQLSKWLW